MSNQCRSCGRDLNNNYTPYTSGYSNSVNPRANNNRQQVSYNTRSVTASATTSGTPFTTQSTTSSNTSSGNRNNNKNSSNNNNNTQVTAKVMFGSVGAIKELREKEKSKNGTARATGRKN